MTVVVTGAWAVGYEPGQRNPFHLYLSNAPAGITRVDLTVASSPNSFLEYVLATVVSQQTRDNFGLEVFGQVRNDQTRPVKGLLAAVTFYDAQGKVYYVSFGYADTSPLPAGATSPYKVSTFQNNLTGLSYTVQAQGYIAP